jgi:hypothetical protein
MSARCRLFWNQGALVLSGTLETEIYPPFMALGKTTIHFAAHWVRMGKSTLLFASADIDCVRFVENVYFHMMGMISIIKLQA